MGDRHDYVALEWVKGEIAETLKQARQALEAYVENPEDSTRMRFCQTYVHQVLGTLQMVEFYGAALLAEEMEQLTQAMIDERVANPQEALEVLMQAVLQLPIYLDRIQSARRDLPMVVLPLLNDLRAARGENLLSETSLFSPDMSERTAALSLESLEPLRTAELPALLRKLRQMLQTALVGILRNQNLGANLSYMAKVFARLEVLCEDAPLGGLWQIASGVVEGLATGSVVNGASVRTLLRQVDNELKRLVETGADGINQAAPDDLIKNLLFYVAKAPASSPRIRALKEQYRLDDALPDSELVDEERARLAGPDRDAMRSVVAALCEELVRVKDSLDLFVRSDRSKVVELDALLGPLKQIADTLAVLGFGQPRKVILDQLDVIHALSVGKREPGDAVLMDVAGALLYVEATLAGMAGPTDEAASQESHLPTTDVAQVHQVVIKESRNGLEQAKDAIIEFIASQWNHEHLARVPELLTQVRGGLAMIPLPRAAALLNACNAYIREQLLDRKAVPNWHNLDTLADAITSVEYYLERLVEDHASQGDLILDVAEESLAALGYPLALPSAAERRPEAVEEAPAALHDPLKDIDVLAEGDEVPALDGDIVDDAEQAELQALFLGPTDAEELSAETLSTEGMADEVPTDSGEALEPLTLPDEPTVEELTLEPFDSSGSALEELTLEGLSLEDMALEDQAPAAAAFGERSLEEPADDGLTFELSLEELSGDGQPLLLEGADDRGHLSADAADAGGLSLEPMDTDEGPDSWSEAELAELELPDIEWSDSLPAEFGEQAETPASEAVELSIADVLAAPVAAINPPAQSAPLTLLPPPADEEPVDADLLEVFIEEAGEVLEAIQEHLPQVRATRDDKHALGEVRRAFHTLKGSGRMVRALVIGELSWSVENLLNRVLDRSVEATDQVMRVVEDVTRLLPALVEEFAQAQQRQRADADLLAIEAHALARGETFSPGSAAPAETAVALASEAPSESVAEPDGESTSPVAALQQLDEVLDPQLLEIFRNEAESHLEAVRNFIQRCEQELPQAVSDELQRALHTLKGSAFMAGILPVAEIAAPLEKLIKEFKANLIPVDLAECELLGKAEVLIRQGLVQLDTAPLAPLAGSQALLDEIQRLHEERLESQLNARQNQSGEARDPQLIGIFLAEGMDILLDAEDLLQRWREHPSERQELSALLDELTTLGRGAEMAELPQIKVLCDALLEIYAAVGAGRLAVSSRFFSEVENAHEVLIGMMDQVAAGLQVSEQPQTVSALHALLAEALDPSSLAAPTGSSAELDDEAQGLLDEWSLPGNSTVESEPETQEDAEDNSWASFEDLSVEEPVAEQSTGEQSSEEQPAVEESAVSEPEPAAEVPATASDSVSLEGLDQEMIEIFLEEAVDILESAGQALDRWIGEPDNALLLSSLQRDLHTLKGGARMAGIAPIGDLAHELESLYEGLVDHRFSHSPALERLLQRSHDRLAQLLDQLQQLSPLGNPGDLVQAIREFRQGRVTETEQPIALENSSAVEVTQEAVEEAETLEQPAAVEDAALSEEAALPEQPASFEEAAVSEQAESFEEAASFEAPLAAEEPSEAEPSDAVIAQEDEFAAEPLPEALPLAAVEIEEPVPASRAAAPEIERDAELVEIFLEEGFDIVDSSGAALTRWLADVDNLLHVESLQRDLHTLKGGARMAEIAEIGDLAHELEFLYEDLGNGRLQPGGELFSLLQSCHDRLAEMLEAVRDQRALPDGNALIKAIAKLRGGSEEEFAAPEQGQSQTVEISVAEGDDEILDIFLEEAEDLFEALEKAVARWQADGSASAFDDILRTLHTLKGGARLSNQRRLGDLTHAFEQMLDDAQKRAEATPEQIGDQVEMHFAALQEELDLLRQRRESNTPDLAAGAVVEDAGVLEPNVEIEIEADADAESEPESGPQSYGAVTLASPIIAASTRATHIAEPKILPFVQRAEEDALDAASRRAPREQVKVPADLLEELVNLAGETSILRGRVEQQVSDFGVTLNEMDATIDRVRDQLRRLDTETQAQILSRHQADAERAGYEDFDPLEMDRYSQLQQLSRALFESASDLLDLKETLAARNRDTETLLLQQARVNTDLQEGLMRTRMVPFERLVPRLKRIVRQISGELDKQVEFVVGNAEGEMDRTVLERIVAPLEHMLRNAVDHGIEAPDVRRAAGKPEHGNVRLSLGREGGDIVLTLADDGRGIQIDAVRRKAIERGMMDADADLSDHEVLQFILEAGFSTAQQVTQISGRGVGMDVVYSEVKQLGGSMSIDSLPGQGTTFTIRLPFTVSMNRALMVLSGEDLYAIPLNTIEGIVRISPYELEAYYGEDAPPFEYAGQEYELKYLGHLLKNGQQPKLVGQSLPLPVILVRSSDHAVAVQVDSLAGSREIVVKSLGPQFSVVHGISGATILGDGRVVVILDLMATIRGLHSQQQAGQTQRAAGIGESDSEQERPTLVMVVDDSVTVRKVTSRLLERNGMNVITARDGVDAISLLQERKPDIMLLDIEMPRMDGFEVATLVRHDEHLKDLPIIMITSRTGDKHRERALSIGVNEYLGKPYQESQLLETILQLVKKP
jgi:chemosensory pili system protein ChpA (sensor histidine kinase/response regulator)